MPTTRLAPSPTGALHLGNARTFLVNWLLARQNGWRIVLRIEDIDGPRIKRGADQAAIDDLRWLGIDWDEGPIYQSRRLDRYDAAIEKLMRAHHAYPCTCSRKDIELAASAPHAADGAVVYPGTCRPKQPNAYGAAPGRRRWPQGTSGEGACERSAASATPEDTRLPTPSRPDLLPQGEGVRAQALAAALRFMVPHEPLAFADTFAGPQSFDPARQLGDFVIRKNDGTPSYQLAVVVDDADMLVTHVVRGDDLLDSTPRQILLYHALGLSDRIPSYTHLPLVVGIDGLRLAKRHGDTRLSWYREGGVPSARVLQLLARWCGVDPQARITCAADLLPHFTLATLPHEPVVFTPVDDARLRSA